MPRLSLYQSNFTAGEISPRIVGRVDIDKYANAAKGLTNCHPVVHGGAVRRAGTFCSQAAKYSGSKAARLIEFVVSRDIAYMLEFGDLYVRVFSPNGVYTGIELVSPYTEAMLNDIDFVQGADTMFLFHESVAPYRLRSFTPAVWDLSAAPFTVMPFDEQGHKLAANLTLGATSGSGITATASAGVFLNSDVGRDIVCSAGIGVVTGFTSSTQLTINILVPFASTSLASGSWYLDYSPFATVTPSAKDPVGAAITLTGSIDTWRTEDVGKYVRINSGLCKIKGYTSPTIVNATIITALSFTTGAPAQSWTLEASVWNAANGYPRTGTLFQQRLWCAGSPKYPQTIWGSKTGLYLDFTKGTADSDGCIFTVASDEINPISYLASARTMIIHTYGGEMIMEGTNDKAITPTNVQIKPQTSYGSRNVRPITIGKESVFVQRAGRKVRAMSYQFQIDGYTCPDLTVLAEHITQSGVVSMAYQQEPDQLLWLVLADGTMLTCTLDRDQQVTGWAKHYTEGAFESVSTIPNGTSEQVWAIVRRTVNGSTVRYVEWFDSTFLPDYPSGAASGYPPVTQPKVYGCTTDCSTYVDNASGQSTFTGLGYLEGKTVDVVADGIVMPQQTVTGGAITIPRTSKRTLIGTHFQSRIDMLTIEAGTGAGTAQGNSMHIGEVTARLLNTLGLQVLDGEGRAQEIEFRKFGADVLDVAPPLFTGNVRIEMLGWERGKAEISLVQDQPLPMHVLSVMRKVTIND